MNGNGGHGKDVEIMSFNIDLLHNEFITVDNLFTPESKIKLHKYLAQLKNKIAGDFTEGDNALELFLNAAEMFGRLDGYNFFVGANLDNTFLILHYSFYHGSSVTSISDIKLPLSEIKTFINKKYQWLCGTNKK